MDHTEKNVAELLVFILEIAFHQAINGFFMAIEMCARPAARLVHGDAMIVFVKQIEQFVEGHFKFATEAEAILTSLTIKRLSHL